MASLTGNPPPSGVTTLVPPVAKEVDHYVYFGKVDNEDRIGGGDPSQLIDPPRKRNDPYFWLRDDERKNEEILQHLRAENEYAQGVTKNLTDLRKIIYDEHISHLKETDSQVPIPFGKRYTYFTRTQKGKSYRIHYRRDTASTTLASGHLTSSDVEELSPEQDQVILDENVIAEGTSHCDIRGVRPSTSHDRLAYSVDLTGDEVYSVRVLDLTTSPTPTVIEEDLITKIAGGITWRDENSYFYVTQDKAKRPYKIWYHRVGSPQSEDSLLFTENDPEFSCGVGKSRTGDLIFIATGSSETSEEWICDLRKVNNKAILEASDFNVVEPRTFGLRYSATHLRGDSTTTTGDSTTTTTGDSTTPDTLVLTTNADKAVENKICVTKLSTPGRSNWQTILDYDRENFRGRKIDDVDCFEKFCVIEGRDQGLTKLWFAPRSAFTISDTNNDNDRNSLTRSWRELKLPEASYEVGTSVNKNYDTNIIRITYSSLAQPNQWLDLTVDTSALFGTNSSETSGIVNNPISLGDFPQKVIKEQAVLEYDPKAYGTERRMATAPDGTQIPISLVFRKEVWDEMKGRPKGGKPLPTMLYGYGSYEICIDPGFHKMILPYLDRGMVYAIAHVRGGGEMGRYWYEEEGKYLNKRNTFSDFIACAESLIKTGVSSSETLAVEGRSAGGLLMGAIANMRPDLFKVVLAGVPFVDVMNTMSDPSIPLTTGEWQEWGNPSTYPYFDYMLSYSPYDQVREQGYPDIVVTAGLYDPRVAYWEPAKWVQKLRKMKTDDNKIILKMDLDSGHFSASDRYKYIREKAWEQAVILERLGLKDAVKFPTKLTA
eukprot:g3222.t1